MTQPDDEPVSRREYRMERDSDRTARKLAAKELKRRLKHLNGEQKRIAVAAAISVRKDLYDADKDATRTAIDALKAAEDKRIGAFRLIGLLAAAGAASGVIGLIAQLWQGTKTAPQTPAPQVYYVPAAPGTLVPSSPQQAPAR
jgi:hypothetical protein